MFNSFFTPTSVKENFNLFHQLNDSARIIKRENHSFHDAIKKEKSNLFKMYANDYIFKGVIPKLYNHSKGIPYYSHILRKAIKSKNYLTNIMEQIKLQKEEEKTLNEINKQKTKRIIKNYELDDAELMKIKKLKIVNRLRLTKKQLIKKNNSFVINSPRINNSLDKSEVNKNSINKSSRIRLKKIKINPFDNINKSFITTSKINKITKLNNILDKCKLGIDQGNSLEKRIEKFFKQIQEEDKNNNDYNKENSILNILKDNKNNKLEEGDSLEKYKSLEEIKMEKLKNEMNLKVSDSFAYSNRNEYKKKIKYPMKIKAFELFEEDLNTINQKNAQKIKIEKEKISKVKNLLDDYIVERELLNHRINKFKVKENLDKKIRQKYEINFEEDEVSKNFEKIKSYLKSKKRIKVIEKLI